MKNQKVAVYIGRFQPLHLGHEKIIREAIQTKNYQHLILVVGSADEARTPKNPFTFEERKKVIETSIERIQQEEGSNLRVSVVASHDYLYDHQKWISEVQHLVANETNVANENIYLIGNIKDESSEYLKYFPQYNKGLTKLFTVNGKVLSATNIRKVLFEDVKEVEKVSYYFKNLLGENAVKFLNLFIKKNKEVFENLKNEYNFIQKYRSQMLEKLPFKTIPFYTGDALVTCAGHILLVKRKVAPGKGLYALPGGFMDGVKDIDVKATALRELKEETKINLSKEILENHLVKTLEFGAFERSPRWRIITNASYFKLPLNELPVVKGSDDAEEAFWMPFVEIKRNRDKFFEDHLSIIDTFLNIL